MPLNRASLVILLAVSAAFAGCGVENPVLVKRYDGPHVEKPYMYGDRCVQANGMAICYTTAGSGPPLIFLRGVGGTVDYWHETMPAFTDDFTVYALDMPGFGKSDKPDCDYSVAFFTDTLVAFMDAMGIERASIVGNSLGGHVAMNLAIEHPERVDKLVLVAATGAWPYPNPILRVALPMIFTDDYFYNWTVADWYKSWRELVKYKTPNSEQKFTEFVRYRHAPEFRDFCRAHARAIKAIFYGSLRGRLDRVHAPALILWGDDDRRHKLDDASYLHKHIPDSRLIVFKGGRQMLPWDFKEDFNREVLSFLKHPGLPSDGARVIRRPEYDRLPTY